MEIFYNLFNVFLHLDKYLGQIINNYGVWTYLIVFLIIFIETGLVILPFLPGDSLLFTIGTFSALGYLNIYTSFIIVTLAAIIGDGVNYHIGKFLGEKVLEYKDSKIFKKEYFEKTHKFYEKYGSKTIVIARFVPIVRTFAPFVAGIGEMSYMKFLSFNIIGALLWSFIVIGSGYFFGNIPFIKNNFSITIIVIIFISILPGIFEYYKAKKNNRQE